MVSHIVGATLEVVAIVLCVIFGVIHKNIKRTFNNSNILEVLFQLENYVN